MFIDQNQQLYNPIQAYYYCLYLCSSKSGKWSAWHIATIVKPNLCLFDFSPYSTCQININVSKQLLFSGL